eukprot:4988090-Amphidinium_carterae.1
MKPEISNTQHIPDLALQDTSNTSSCSGFRISESGFSLNYCCAPHQDKASRPPKRLDKTLRAKGVVIGWGEGVEIQSI